MGQGGQVRGHQSGLNPSFWLAFHGFTHLGHFAAIDLLSTVSGCPLWVTSGNPQSEHREFAFPPKADVSADIASWLLRARSRPYVLPSRSSYFVSIDV